MIQEEFRFNDEFLRDPVELQRMQTNFPSVAFAFHTPEAGELFVFYDEKAKAAKRHFQIYGLFTVALALSALLAGAADMTFISSGQPEGTDFAPSTFSAYAVPIAATSALLGLLAVLIGWAGVGIGERKNEWLRNRYICERIRLWQAQYVCIHVADIVDAACAPNLRARYEELRRLAFQDFVAVHVEKVAARLSALLGDERKRRFELPIDFGFRAGMISLDQRLQSRTSESAQSAAALKEVFAAYDSIRFRAQVDYAEYMRGPGQLSSHVKTQHQWLSHASTILLVTIIVLHIGVVVGVVFNNELLKSHAFHFLAVAAALCSLAVRVLEDGLQADAHLVRLEDYADVVSEARAKFNTTVSASDKFHEMTVLEEAASRELDGFLRTVSIARYVL